MKTLTEFAAPTIKNALAKKQELVAAGKTAEELPAAMGEALTLEGDKLTYMLAALELLGTQPGDLKRVIVSALHEGEKAPSSAKLVGEKYYSIEHYPAIHKRGAPGQEAMGGRDGGRGGRRDGKGGKRGERGSGGRDGGRGPGGGGGGRDGGRGPGFGGRDGGRGPGRGDRPAEARADGPKPEGRVIINAVAAGAGEAAANRPPRAPRAPRPPRKPREPRPDDLRPNLPLPKPLATPIAAMPAKTEAAADSSVAASTPSEQA